MNTLKFIDLLTLKLIVAHYRKYGVSPVMDELFDNRRRDSSMVNNFIAANGITDEYTSPIGGQAKMDAVIKRLREAGLIEPAITYAPTDVGLLRIEELPDDWRKWPSTVPVKEGSIKWSEGDYVPL